MLHEISPYFLHFKMHEMSENLLKSFYHTIFYDLPFVSNIMLSQGNLAQERYYCLEKVTRSYGVYFSEKPIKPEKMK